MSPSSEVANSMNYDLIWSTDRQTIQSTSALNQVEPQIVQIVLIPSAKPSHQLFVLQL